MQVSTYSNLHEELALTHRAMKSVLKPNQDLTIDTSLSSASPRTITPRSTICTSTSTRMEDNSMATPIVQVSAVEAGSLTLPEHFFCADQKDKTVRNTVPSLSFLIQHPSSGKRILFDLGMRRDTSKYLPQIQKHLESRQPLITFPDAAESLRRGGLKPEKDINAVILSHSHYDHVGTPGDFSKAYFIVGPGTKHLLLHGMKYHSAAHFEKDLLPEDRTIELPNPDHVDDAATTTAGDGVGEQEVFDKVRLEDFTGLTSVAAKWMPLMPFPHAIDIFGDTSLYVISAPGHLQGHLNVLARVGEQRWLYLAGDACHHPRILRGETEMATWDEGGMTVCIHEDKKKAEETVRRIAVAVKKGLENHNGIVEVALAHDRAWADEHKDAFFPGHI